MPVGWKSKFENVLNIGLLCDFYRTSGGRGGSFIALGFNALAGGSFNFIVVAGITCVFLTDLFGRKELPYKVLFFIAICEYAVYGFGAQYAEAAALLSSCVELDSFFDKEW